MVPKVLIVDDERSILDIIGHLLRVLGFEYETAMNGGDALDKLRSGAYEILITDVNMPGLAGVELVEQVRTFDQDIGIIVITGMPDLNIAVQIIQKGANEFLIKPVRFDMLQVSIEKCLTFRHMQQELRAYQLSLENKIEQRTEQLRQALLALQSAHEGVKFAQNELVLVLAKTAESNDEDTGYHIQRVSEYVAALASQMGHPPAEVEELSQHAMTHDIGKVTVHPDILRKPGKLTRDEFDVIKQHTVNGAEILEQAPSLTPAVNIARYHHERYDGTGYPDGLIGEAIPIEARITSIADVFDALTMKRCYKDPWPVDEAVDFIKKESGHHFDPAVVDAFQKDLSTILDIRNQFPD